MHIDGKTAFISGVGVSVLCPEVTQTNLAANTNRLVGLPPVEMSEGFGISPTIAGEQGCEAILANAHYIFTHGEYVAPPVQRRARRVAAAAAAEAAE